jgi:SAM-dependent methyltransferase
LATEYYIPQLHQWGITTKNKKILDVGCGNGGFISAFEDAQAIGVEIKPFPWKENHVNFNVGDITHIDFQQSLDSPVDLIILRDVIEHIPLDEKHSFLSSIKNLMHENTKILMTFPPFYSPFGLHQQVFCNSVMKKIPFLSWMPTWGLKPMAKIMGESNDSIDELIEINRCRMTIGGFKKLISSQNLNIEQEQYFSIRPSHEIRYGWKTRTSILGKIPLFKECFILGTFYLLSSSED